MDRKVKAKARVSVLLEVSLSDTWGSDCQLDQVYKQAKDSAMNMIHRKMTGGGQRDIRIIGDPKVTAILTQMEE